MNDEDRDWFSGLLEEKIKDKFQVSQIFKKKLLLNGSFLINLPLIVPFSKFIHKKLLSKALF